MENKRHMLLGLYAEAQFILPHEDLDRYKPGGFHPVNLGDTLCDGRYTIRHKLGYGGYSIVWLARDNAAGKWVSIKVKTAASSTERLDDDPEIDVLKRLDKLYADSPRQIPRPSVQLLDCFHEKGPNGTHNCLVTELLGPSLSNILECYDYRHDTFRPDTILRSTCQLLEALAFFHQEGVVHGDVSNSNVAFTCKNAVESEEDLFDALGEPATAEYTDSEIPWWPELPRHLVQVTGWPGWYESCDGDVRLIDVGASFPADGTVAKISQPRNVRSPETFFIKSFDYRHDLWRAGCVIYSTYYQEPPFISFREKDDIFIRRLVMKLGPLPDEWQGVWEELQKQNPYAAHDALLVPPAPITETFEPRRSAIISSCEDEDGEYERDEHTDYDCNALASLLWVIKNLLEYRPEKRPSAQEVAAYVRSKWIDFRKESEAMSPTQDS
ncbi:Protein kinase-like domain protein [Niveomyces insectorum RCEF 264]|uniref:Protein kinase-like domain protein n=1 Tax=Niveomyces insectorum RCEF 264 TaxID=1081102 RepID=A0A167S3E2_9HYPO|nr:Protein kinase-like domain protein [Niveomyces insectorum RCEF 264]